MTTPSPKPPALRTVLLGLRLRCPHCGRGHLFRDLFTLHPTCAVCRVRFERSEGESLGGMMINLGMAEVLSIGGFIVTQALFNPPILFQAVFWGVFNIVFVVGFYRHARGAWIAMTYLTGGVYADPQADDDRPATPSPPPKAP